MSRLQIDSERCTGHGRCYAVAPDLFASDEFGYGQVIEHAAVDEEEVLRAVQNCPENAIVWERE